MKIVHVYTGNAYHPALTEVIWKALNDNGVPWVELHHMAQRFMAIQSVMKLCVILQPNMGMQWADWRYNWNQIVLFYYYCIDEDTNFPTSHFQTEPVYRLSTIERDCKEIVIYRKIE